MPQTIIFDTNYLRTFSQLEYLAGKIPEKLRTQIVRAVERGDLVALVDTVRIETNAWLERAHQKKQQDLNAAVQRLITEGYTVNPPHVLETDPPDILHILQSASDKCITIAPTLADYKEAERRTSYRHAPLPKNPDGEEMRDRLIWCQILRLAKEHKNSILIVSGDTIFKNGANSKEGVEAGITVVEGEVDFDQRLGERPPHITAVINLVLTFAQELNDLGINLTQETIVGIEGLRKVQEADGSITQRFLLLTSGEANLDPQCLTSVNSIDNQPLSLTIAASEPISLTRQRVNLERPLLNSQERAIHELRWILGKN